MKATPRGVEPTNGQHANNETANENGQHKPGSFAALLEQAQSIQNMLRDALLRTNQLLGGLKQYRRQAKVDEQHAGFAAATSGSRGVTICAPGEFVPPGWSTFHGLPWWQSSEIH